MYSNDKNDLANTIKLHDQMTGTERLSALVKTVDQQKKELKSSATETDDMEEDLKSHISQLISERAAYEQRNQDSIKEIAELLHLLADREKTIHELETDFSWSRQVIMALTSVYEKSLRNVFGWISPRQRSFPTAFQPSACLRQKRRQR